MAKAMLTKPVSRHVVLTAWWTNRVAPSCLFTKIVFGNRINKIICQFEDQGQLRTFINMAYEEPKTCKWLIHMF